MNDQVDGMVEGKEEMLSTNFEEILERLRHASLSTSDRQLADILGIDRQNITAAKKKKRIPPNWIIKIGEQFGVSFDWLVYGTGAMHRGDEREESRGGSESLGSRPGSKEESRRPVKPEILREVIIGIEKFMEARNVILAHEKKAELTLVLYEMFLASGEVEPDILERYLRLVA